jgi:uncharacterized membrane protein
MNRFVDPLTGRLVMPEIDPAEIAARRRRTRWSIRFILVFGIIDIVSLTFSLATLSKAYVEVRIACAVGLALSVVLVGLAVWAIRKEK